MRMRNGGQNQSCFLPMAYHWSQVMIISILWRGRMYVKPTAMQRYHVISSLWENQVWSTKALLASYHALKKTSSLLGEWRLVDHRLLKYMIHKQSTVLQCNTTGNINTKLVPALSLTLTHTLELPIIVSWSLLQCCYGQAVWCQWSLYRLALLLCSPWSLICPGRRKQIWKWSGRPTS